MLMEPPFAFIYEISYTDKVHKEKIAPTKKFKILAPIIVEIPLEKSLLFNFKKKFFILTFNDIIYLYINKKLIYYFY